MTNQRLVRKTAGNVAEVNSGVDDRLRRRAIPLVAENGWYGKWQMAKSVGVGKEDGACPDMVVARAEAREAGPLAREGRLRWGGEVEMFFEKRCAHRNTDGGVQEPVSITASPKSREKTG